MKHYFTCYVHCYPTDNSLATKQFDRVLETDGKWQGGLTGYGSHWLSTLFLHLALSLPLILHHLLLLLALFSPFPLPPLLFAAKCFVRFFLFSLQNWPNGDEVLEEWTQKVAEEHKSHWYCQLCLTLFVHVWACEREKIQRQWDT